MVETSPKALSEKVLKYNYRRAFIFFNYHTLFGDGLKGFAKYYHKNFIWLTMTLWMCDTLKMHKRWRNYITEHPYTNSEGNFLI